MQKGVRCNDGVVPKKVQDAKTEWYAKREQRANEGSSVRAKEGA